MGNINLQLGGGYKHQWEIAILLALEYLFPNPSGFNRSLHKLIINHAGRLKNIQLEGVHQEIEPGFADADLIRNRELEDINLIYDEGLILIQVKAKEDEGKSWTMSEEPLLKALNHFLENYSQSSKQDYTNYVFLTNISFESTLGELIRKIEEGHTPEEEKIDDKVTALGKLYTEFNKYRSKKKLQETSFIDFRDMLKCTKFIHYLPIESVEGLIEEKLKKNGKAK